MTRDQQIKNKQLRIFGIALTVFLSIIGLINLWKGNALYYQYFWGVAAILLLSSLLFPVTIKPIYRVSLFIAHILGWINTRLILAIIYYLLFTPISLIMKILGKDLLNRKFDRNANSYWHLRPHKTTNKNQYMKQF